MTSAEKGKLHIEVPRQTHLVNWLRFLLKCREHDPKTLKKVIVDFRKTDNILPYHLVSLACLIEEFHLAKVRIEVKKNLKTSAGKFIRGTKFETFWTKGFDRNFALNENFRNVLPLWQLSDGRIDSYANITQRFFANHKRLKGKDLDPLRLTIVEALNNINDHANSKVKGFVFTQFYKNRAELVVSICDFGKGIPNLVNKYLKSLGKQKLSDIAALEKALEHGFSTKSTPKNRGFGLDTILSNVKAAQGQIIIVSNKAFLMKQVSGKTVNDSSDNLEFSFPGTYIVIRLKSSRFLKNEEIQEDEMGIF